MSWWKKSDKQDRPAPEARLEATVSGQVQGVGFRYWTRSEAVPLGLTGYAKNLDDGRVEIVAEGTREACEQLRGILGSGDTAGSVANLDARLTDPTGEFKGFGTY